VEVKIMATLTLTDEQIIELVKQLPLNKQAQVCELLLVSQWGGLDNFTKDGEHHARLATWKRGLNWDAMNDEERIDFVNNIVHEDRQCAMY
jgi:hypothetical protein